MPALRTRSARTRISPPEPRLALRAHLYRLIPSKTQKMEPRAGQSSEGIICRSDRSTVQVNYWPGGKVAFRDLAPGFYVWRGAAAGALQFLTELHRFAIVIAKETF